MHDRVVIVGDVIYRPKLPEVAMINRLDVVQANVEVAISVTAVLLVEKSEGVANLVQYSSELEHGNKSVGIKSSGLDTFGNIFRPFYKGGDHSSCLLSC